MKKIFLFFLVFILLFSMPLSVLAEDSENEEYLDTFLEVLESILVAGGYIFEDIGNSVPLAGTFGEVLQSVAYLYDPEGMAEYDAMLGDGSITEAYYYQQLIGILEDNGVYSLDGNSAYISEEFCNAVLDYIESSDLVNYKVYYSIAPEDIPVSIFPASVVANDMIEMISLGYHPGHVDDNYTKNPITVEGYDEQVYLVTGMSNGGRFTNVSGLCFVAYNTTHWNTICNGSIKNLQSASVGFYSAEGVSAVRTSYMLREYYHNGSRNGDTWVSYYSNLGNESIYKYVSNNKNYFSYFVDDGSGRVPILIFRDAASLVEYSNGQASYYMIPSEYQGGDMVVNTNIDYRELYDAISAAIAAGDYLTPTEIQKAVEEAASEYLDRIAQNTADINDALRDQEGNSWLRRISGTLDDLAEGFQEYSSSMLSEIKSGFAWIKTELAAILAVGVVDLVWEDVQADIEEAAAMAASLKDLAESKFPFSIPRDIGLLLTMFRAEPVEPVFEIPFNFMGEETIVTLDLTSAEDFLPYVRAGFILVFMAGLLGLSIKIIPIISGGA